MMHQVRHSTAIRLLCGLLVCLLFMSTLLGCRTPEPDVDPPVEESPDSPSTNYEDNIISFIPDPDLNPDSDTDTDSDVDAGDRSYPEEGDLSKAVFWSDINWDGTLDRVVVDRLADLPITVYSGTSTTVLYKSSFSISNRETPGGVALIKEYYEQYDAMLEWSVSEQVNPSNYRQRRLTIRYTVLQINRTTGEVEKLKNAQKSFDTSSEATYAYNEGKILDLLNELDQYFRDAYILVDTSSGFWMHGDPEAPTHPTYEYEFTPFVPVEPAPTAANLLMKMQEAMAGVNNLSVLSTTDMTIRADGTTLDTLSLQQSEMRFEGLYEEYPRLYAAFDLYGTSFAMTIAGTTLYYDLGAQGKYMILMLPRQQMDLMSQYTAGINSPAYDTSHFGSKTIAKDAQDRWVITLSKPDATMTEQLYAAITESVQEGVSVELSDLDVTYCITLDESSRIASQELTASFAADEEAEFELYYTWEYGYDNTQTLGVPADYADYIPCTYEDFYPSQYSSMVMPLEDLNSDCIAEYLYLVDDPYHYEAQPTLNIGLYDPTRGTFIYWDEIMRTHFSAEGCYVYYDEQDTPYLLLYSIQRAEQGVFASDTNIPAFASLSYAVLRIKPEENGIFTYHDLLMRKVAYLYDPEIYSWEQNEPTLIAFLDELNALLANSIPLLDTSSGELLVNTQGEAFPVEIDPLWLFGDFVYTLDAGFVYDRTTLEVTSGEPSLSLTAIT